MVEQRLNDQPEVNAKSIFARLQAQFPESLQQGQLRTLQRRVKQWRSAIARGVVLGCYAAPAEAAQNKEEVIS
jgi:hypothetical protein